MLRARLLLTALLVLSAPSELQAARRTVAETPSDAFVARPPAPDAYPPLPKFHRSTSGTTWVQVHSTGTSPCPPSSVNDVLTFESSRTTDEVWCFEGAGGDSTWPANPSSGGFDHWSKFDPPGGAQSKWHVTTRHGGPSTGTYSAWAGCDSVGTNPACAQTAYWVFQEGYGDDWNYPLVLTCSGQDASAGGTIEFDLRYDTECNYDYLFLEYLQNSSGNWLAVVDTAGTAAVFNAVSGNPDASSGGTGRSCGGDIYAHSDEADLGGGNQVYYGNSIWLEDVTFPLPAQTGDTQLRWRARSDGAWSDSDGRGDTDGIGSVDNVEVTFTADGAVVTDDFETGDLNGASASIGTAAWTAGGLVGPTFDGWHLRFSPNYGNKGNTCIFGDDWMWTARQGPIPNSANGFDFFLVSPVIEVTGWMDGHLTHSGFIHIPGEREDYPSTNVRVYQSGPGWSPWQDVNGGVIPLPTFGWLNHNVTDLGEFLDPPADSLQIGWEFRDLSTPGSFNWGKHGGSQYTVDEVSIARVDGSRSVFTARDIDLFADTFSLSDPAHTPFLQNAEQGDWSAHAGGTRTFANVDSLSVSVHDEDGVSAGNVLLWWRHDDGGTGFGVWSSKAMDFSIPDPLSASEEGTYRQIIGADDGGVEDGTVAGDRLIWKPGTTVEYYVKVTDDLSNDDAFPEGAPFEFSMLPFYNTSPAQGSKTVLLVDDYGRDALDVETSLGFDPVGGIGSGSFDDPRLESSEAMTRAALDAFGLVYDAYDVQGAGSSVQAEPNGIADSGNGVGGFLDDLGIPVYDCIIWLQGRFDEYSFADTTRIALASHLDNAGNLLTCGDQIAFHLGAGGNDADSALGFLGTYLGTEFPSNADEMTEERVLSVLGNPGTPFDGVKLGLYGECPHIRRTFDRLTLATPAPGSANEVLMEYADGGPGDDGRPAVIRNTRTTNGGEAVLAAFDHDALLGDDSRACFLEGVLGAVFGITIPSPQGCIDDGVGVPEIAPGSAWLVAAQPNPFAAHTTIAFRLPRRGHVRLELFDVRGRRVRTLVDGALGADLHERAWDGRDDGGAAVASGVYFYRMTTEGFTETRRVTLVR